MGVGVYYGVKWIRNHVFSESSEAEESQVTELSQERQKATSVVFMSVMMLAKARKLRAASRTLVPPMTKRKGRGQPTMGATERILLQ